MILMVFYLESKYGKDWADPSTSTLNYKEYFKNEILKLKLNDTL
jgi:hypothetical protein